ncbi:hypothetical protein [Methylobacterium nodulans]|uniref:hypothetical protein n=1 Tax=Methylobacterium nodulans TaxID=114616 RepID=UPI001FCCB0DF|nr:hypothetical protein [Methylobacterium nodulans]
MPLHVDHRWHFAGGAATREKRVYRDGRLIGRVRRWQMIELSGRHRSWFTVEQWQSDAFHRWRDAYRLRRSPDLSCLHPFVGADRPVKKRRPTAPTTTTAGRSRRRRSA